MTGEYADSPFFAASLALELPESANFLGAGDFDADGHWDLVAAAASGHGLYLLRGDGHGAFAAARSVKLPGRVTALVTGEINRADGLTDIIVAVAAESGPKLLAFEGPEGALRSKPEEFSLPGEAAALALGAYVSEGRRLDLCALGCRVVNSLRQPLPPSSTEGSHQRKSGVEIGKHSQTRFETLKG